MMAAARIAGPVEEQVVKKPTLMELPAHDEPQPNNIHRADITPLSGFILEIDGRMKRQFESDSEARTEALRLKSRFPMLQVRVYDAVEKTRVLISPSADAAREADATSDEVG